jgi:hypothetical protein
MGSKEFSCGQGIEALIKDDYHDNEYWVASRIEHNGEDNYLVGYYHIALEELTVRTR